MYVVTLRDGKLKKKKIPNSRRAVTAQNTLLPLREPKISKEHNSRYTTFPLEIKVFPAHVMKVYVGGH